ncbi:hypothetical protein Ddc_11955 [Ditylenchus destructor]|nr:hypothetical protein Ddc_11955 [Ditylenchus destructor]
MGEVAQVGPAEVYQHGSIGDFITSTIEGVQSGFIRCVYKAKNAPNNTVTLLCEKVGGCCLDGCCPKDQFWMVPLIVLLIFCLVIFVIGCVSMIFCYQRSKNKQRKEEKMAYEYGMSGSEAAMYPRSTASPQQEFPYGGGFTGMNTLNNAQYRPRY